MDLNAASYLSKQAIINPKGSAIIVPPKNSFLVKVQAIELSFRELDDKTGVLASYFKAMGIQKGSRVLMMVKPGLDLIQVVFALLKLGAVPIVIDPGMGMRRFFQSAADAKASFIIGGRIAICLSKVYAKNKKHIKKFISLDTTFRKELLNFRNKEKEEVVPVKGEDLAAILFTSGSTGPAKGVCYTHGMFSAQIELIQKQYKIAPGEVDLPMLPVFALFNPAFGTCTVVPDMNPSRPASVNPRKIVTSILENKVTYSFGSPAIWTKIVSYCEALNIQMPSLRRVMMAGAPAPQSLLIRLKKFLPNGEIHTPYGATEALPVTTISASEIFEKQVGLFNHGRKGICVGRAFPSVGIKVIQVVNEAIETIEAIQECAVGEVGEIIVTGPSVTKFYDGLKEATAISKIHDGKNVWHRMGDVGWIDADGFLWFCGRKVERVVVGNKIFETVCCESVFNQMEFVARSALVAIDNKPCIVIEPVKEAFPKDDAAKRALTKLLRQQALSDPNTELIKDFYFEQSFPVDIRHNAKIHRLSLAKKLSNSQ